ncbi:VQ motif-containing protein 22 [Artemisia annua]|uniref:VQ motif-containing protein 22 n=1 Tax=Artemisia annua TaxID=35608 RepID=A0A2U1LDG9_ARTAN|nr:VQ motif-containing protein 22 [Artemisia annua]
MDGMSPFSADNWIQQYPNNIAMDQSGGAPSVAATIPGYGDSSQRATGQDSPKPIRRRSRASRRTPTTVLNASPNDFRALVQRFTGYDSKESVASASASVVSLPKGPVNIDFARNDVNESSSRYAYFDNQVRLPQQVEQIQSVGGLTDFQPGYRMENASAVYESIHEEPSLMETRRDGASHGYNL